MQVEFEIHDILKDDAPLEDGYYLVFRQDPDGQSALTPMYWHSDKRAWGITKDSDGLLVPVEYWGRYWTKNFLNGVVKI